MYIVKNSLHRVQNSMHGKNKAIPNFIYSDIANFVCRKVIEELETKCLKTTNHLANEKLTYETPSDYDPLSVNMGQMVVYRFTIRDGDMSAKFSFTKVLDKNTFFAAFLLFGIFVPGVT